MRDEIFSPVLQPPSPLATALFNKIVPQPWLLVEVKTSGKAKLSRHLAGFKKKTGARYALQGAMDLDFVDADCFAGQNPIIEFLQKLFCHNLSETQRNKDFDCKLQEA